MFLSRNSSNFTNIFLLYVNFENIIIGLHVLIIPSILAKFQEDQRLVAMPSINGEKFCPISIAYGTF